MWSTSAADSQGDLPPGIDEPSLPALPQHLDVLSRPAQSAPPSFDASEAAAGVRTSEAPPGYFGEQQEPAQPGGLPPYS